MIIPTYSQFRTNYNISGSIAADGLLDWPVAKVRETGSGFGDTGSTLVNIPKPPRNHTPLNISCNNFLPDAVPFTPEYQWYVSSRSQDPANAALLPSSANLRFVSAVGVDILGTVDGGLIWTKKVDPTSPSSSFLDVSAPSTAHRWAVGSAGAIITSQTSGETWQTQTSGVTEGLTSVDFVDTSVGWVGGEGCTVLYTGNGGALWTTVLTPGHTFDITAISFVSGGRGIVAGAAGETLWTNDTGATWNNVSLGIGYSVTDIDLLPTAVGWAVAGPGFVYKTTNGGSTYTQQFVGGTTYTLVGACAVNNNTAYVVGESGYIIKTVDGGTTWTELTSGVTALLMGVTFINVNEGWACGHDQETGASVIIYTADAGATWASQDTLAPGILLGIDSPRVVMGAMSFSGTVTLPINSSSAPSVVMTPELVASTFKHCHAYVQRLSDSAIQWVDLLRAMVANTG